MRNGIIAAGVGVAVLGVVLAVPATVQAAGLKPASAAYGVPSPESRVDINHASMAELMKIPGMTRSWAGRIERFRPYHAKSDLLERGVLPSDVYDRIKDYIIAHREKK